MKRVKIGFSGKSVTVQVEKARDIVTKMTGNANFTTPNPTLASVTTAVDALEVAYNESRNRDKVKIAIMKLRRAELLSLMVLLGAYVQTTSGGDEEKILSSGFEVVKTPTPAPPVGAVQNLRLEPGNNLGIVDCKWDTMPGAVVYIIEVSPDPLANSTFNAAGPSTKTRFSIENLNPGTRYWVRVAAIDKFGLGAYSDPATIIAV